MMAACPTCYSLDKARRPPKDFIPSIPGFNGSFWIFTVSLKDASLSEVAGCQFCQVLSKTFRHILKRYGKCIDSADATATIAVPFYPTGFDEFHATFKYAAIQRETKLVQKISKRYYMTTIQKRTAILKDDLPHADDAEAQTGPLRTLNEGGYIPSNPFSELCFRKISSWIRDCASTHSSMDCMSKRLGTSGFVPMRLIEVGTGAAVSRIVETRVPVAAYTALSYCWGNVQIPVTNRANLSDRQRRLPWTSLPNVFRDAIVLTRALSVKYIWIDAICIIQDDHADVSAQLRQMGQIYREAYLVISADSASSANDRLFKERPQPMYLRITSPNRSAEASEVLLHEGIDHQSLGGRTLAGHNWPLARRGWTLQERFLATRIIHISAAEIVWECNERLRCECKFLDQRGQNLDDLFWTSLRSRFIHTLDVGVSGNAKAKCWCLIVSEYSGRLFSNDFDRLPAIAGLASRFANSGIGEYRAGIWTKYVLTMISWHRSQANSGRRPLGYLAPSWSWVSFIGQIDWEFSNDWDFSDTVDVDNRSFVAEVLNIECCPSGADPFGSVCGGYLTISSPTMTVAVRPSEEGGRELDLHMRHTFILDVDSPSGITELQDAAYVKCLFLENHGSVDAPALVLIPHSFAPGVFTRIGRLFVHERTKLPEFTREVLTIY